MGRSFAFVLVLLLPASPLMGQTTTDPERPRARDAGVVVGVFPPGPLNAITDVGGVRVGQVTITEADRVRTGVTAILPHGGDPFRDRVPAAIHVGNGFGKLLGVTQVQELGVLETPILLTCTLCVWQAADALVDWLLARPGMEDVRSINPVVGETNDGGLNDIRSRPIRAEHVVAALETAAGGPVAVAAPRLAVDPERAGPADTAPRLGKFFKTGAAFWMNIQARYDLETAEDVLAPEIKRIASYEAA
jgi:D-aminopeptidase